jgi:hypothetical protein
LKEFWGLTGILAMNLDVASDKIHYAKTIHNTRCEHSLSRIHNILH